MNKLQEILKIIQFETDFSFTEIGKEIGYSREHISVSKKAGDNESIILLLKEKFKKEILQFERRYKYRGVLNSELPDLSPEPSLGQIAKVLQGLAAAVEKIDNNTGEQPVERGRRNMVQVRKKKDSQSKKDRSGRG